ncbi:MAG: hypothetical protein KKG09_09460 [Verrucomicrobia bacterium]|nr:hypothetical protein [Verrucomicrobiota bacterium]MCG2678402.1 hypothetical protein [Kiritimatiellia bacterium]MBU4247219.1 hypothetical protein [Verrucomicrobiota bacterium]MBU4291831.1 hypothetical protein [Verrucomicrobiota bacterium]MBU4430388.1 hypothetical protein [Verrucomicrobiota bacterium]
MSIVATTLRQGLAMGGDDCPARRPDQSSPHREAPVYPLTIPTAARIKSNQADAARYRSPRNGWNNRRNEASRACPARDKTKRKIRWLIGGMDLRIAAA